MRGRLSWVILPVASAGLFGAGMLLGFVATTVRRHLDNPSPSDGKRVSVLNDGTVVFETDFPSEPQGMKPPPIEYLSKKRSRD